MGVFSRLFGRRTDVPEQSRHVPRTPMNLPSLTIVILEGFLDYPALVRRIQLDNKDLVSLVGQGWTVSQAEARGQLELLWHFADNPNLVIMRFPQGNQIIVRSSFMKATASDIRASTISELADQLSSLARSRGLSVETTTR